MTALRRSVQERLEAAWWRYTDAAALAELAADPSPKVRAAVAGRRDLPEVVAGLLAGDQRPAVRIALARNPSCPPRLLAVLLDDPNAKVRIEIPTNPATDTDIVARILACPHAILRSMLFDHPALTAEWELALAHDPDVSVRSKVAELTKRPDVLAVLVADPKPSVRCAAVVNPLTTRAQLAALAGDPARDVRDLVRYSGRVWED